MRKPKLLPCTFATFTLACVQFFLQESKIDLHKPLAFKPEVFELRSQGVERKLFSAFSHIITKNSGPCAGVQRQIPLLSGRQSSAWILKELKSWRSRSWSWWPDKLRVKFVFYQLIDPKKVAYPAVPNPKENSNNLLHGIFRVCWNLLPQLPRTIIIGAQLLEAIRRAGPLRFDMLRIFRTHQQAQRRRCRNNLLASLSLQSSSKWWCKCALAVVWLLIFQEENIISLWIKNLARILQSLSFW